MPTFSIEFANHLSTVAKRCTLSDAGISESNRTVLYISLLSVEVALKAFLEKSGLPIKSIKDCSHDLGKLLRLIDKIEVDISISSSVEIFASGKRLRSVTVNSNISNGTVGALIDQLSDAASVYPGEIRYGEDISHFPPELVSDLAASVIAWVEQYAKAARIPVQ